MSAKQRRKREVDRLASTLCAGQIWARGEWFVTVGHRDGDDVRYTSDGESIERTAVSLAGALWDSGFRLQPPQPLDRVQEPASHADGQQGSDEG